MAKTLFEKIIDRELPATIVYEDEHCLAFRDINPGAPVHILVIPRKPIPRLCDATADDQTLLGHLMLTANKIAEASAGRIAWSSTMAPTQGSRYFTCTCIFWRGAR